MESCFKVNIPVIAGLMLGAGFLAFYFISFEVPDFEVSCLLSIFCTINIFISGYSKRHTGSLLSIQKQWIWFLVCSGTMAAGLFFESVFIISAGWACLMGILLWRTQMVNTKKCAVWCSIFLLLSFPWFGDELHYVGVIFRYGGAFVTDYLAGIIGLDSLRKGTLLNIEGVDISVSEACSGMATLQGMIIIGFYLFHGGIRSVQSFIIILFSVFVLAFITNTIRILLNSFVILTFGVKVGMGITHDIVGLLISGLLFYLFATYIPKIFCEDFRNKPLHS